MIQGWVQQPSLEEFENLLSSQESLAKQMASISIKEGEGNALMARKKSFKSKENQDSLNSHRRAKLQESNVVNKIVEEEDWGKCLVTETK